ncbi:ATP-binding protein [Crossiella cryophila]|uniref:Putative ATPase/DNA-binding CsgD family transcriptional regulator n=1 Tax=Crossiella cryophila TaxID=43355 RepID=A0A7W7C3P4_9PSEU|nr:LuxR C-terminal-related transcriptional regulator [Crossiella cryophila]MBB4673976.1 putative ATPase/DNA-binding CsgD family transcriptional regulator [Crossiella cryophila]
MGSALSPRPAGNLPAEVNTLVGRRPDIAEVKRQLSGTRLLTLTGVGGVGKTRLAARAAAELRRSFRDGVWLVELADLTGPELVPHAVATALGLHDDTGRDRLEVLAEQLRARTLLLVLDNCEHLLDACATLAARLLRAAPGLRVLATSRQPLGVAGEQVWPVPPLVVPDPAADWQPDTALTLFAERAAAVAPDFALTAENRPTVARLCQQLDGLPLAIELAAVRVRALTVGEIEERLHDRYGLLTGGSRAALPRHQTLRAAVDWSFELCAPREQLLWARLSVFAGTFDLAAAGAVCSGDGLLVEEVFDLVAGLVDKSILSREDHPGGARYRLLETLREFGREKLGAPARTTVRTRHCAHYLRLIERAEHEWFGPRQLETFRWLESEHANLRAALEFCLAEADRTEHGLRLAGALWCYWAGCGYLAEGGYWLGRALELSPADHPARRKALWVNGYVATLQGRVDIAVATLTEVRALAEADGDDVVLAYAIHRQGCLSLIGDDLDRAVELFDTAMAHYHRLDLLDGHVLMCYVELAVALAFQGEFDRAAQLCHAACALSNAAGERWASAYATFCLGLVDFCRGDLAAAREGACAALRAKRDFHDLLGIVLAVELLAWVAAAEGQPERAAVLLGATEAQWGAVGYPLFGSRYFTEPHARCAETAQAAISAAAFTAAHERGRDLTTDAAIDLALGQRPPARPRPDRAAEPSLLTRRERQVAELVAEGLSNKEIAERLVIAVRTAEGHVERILQKLGFSSRARIAAWVAERRSQSGGSGQR